ncbi:hypothetical protein SprV_0501846500 [Sparganum proliferum]
MGTQYSSPGNMVCIDAGVEVTKHDQSIRLRHSFQENMQAFVELAPWRIRADHGRSVDADDCGEFASLEKQAETHQAIVDALRLIGRSPHDIVPDGKGDARVPTFCLGATAPEEVVAGTRLLQLALLLEPGLTECSDIHLVARQFPSQ